MQGNSSPVISTQVGTHVGLQTLLQKHFSNGFAKPIAAHTLEAFSKLPAHIHEDAGRNVVLDSGCGTGASSLALAHQYPDNFIIGIDKSADRLEKRSQAISENCFLLRAEAGDFWRLALRENWRLSKHYLLYPNPWPKPRHLQRRWQGSPVFPQLLELGGELELRSNWQIYMLEFQQALAYAGFDSTLQELPCGESGGAAITAEPISPFEAKYTASGHKLWRLTASLDDRTQLSK